MNRLSSILVVGVCQANHLGRILNAIPSVVSRFNVCAIELCADPITGEYRTPPPEILETCECVYFQRGTADVLPGYMERLIAQGKSQRFPIMFCQALWPAHTELRRKLPEPGLPWGRFPYCDRVLLDLLETGQEDSRIADRYLHTDLARMFDLDRLVELWRYQMEDADKSCDVVLAELQWREWRDTRHYWALSHPTNRLFGEVLRKLLARTIGPVAEEELLGSLRANELDQFMTPIHPSVARHFGLKWCSPDDLYAWPDGPFTIRQWALEHVRYTRRVLAMGDGTAAG